MKHKSEDYKISDVEYYLVEDKSQEDVCKIILKQIKELNINTEIIL